MKLWQISIPPLAVLITLIFLALCINSPIVIVIGWILMIILFIFFRMINLEIIKLED